jgi:serine/threonine-protein kinase
MGDEVDPWVGRVLANVYKVDAKIGEGGMGAVYRATHVNLGKQVAVKVLTDAIAQKRDAVERLRQEAIAASSIDHDNIVDVVSFDRYDDGSVFIVMELLRGESLAERIEALRAAGRALSLAETVQIALQICDALGAAHERGIVHRDLKPENVFLAKKGERERVKVLDFGISKIKTAEAEQVRMTRTGQLVGTPLYMSPEQARGETDIDRRVDVYALGVMLFEMLSGAPPFDGRNYFELLWKHGNEPPPSLRERYPQIACPAQLDDAVQRALAKDRDARFQTMGELADALRAAVPELSLPGASIPPELRTSRSSGETRTPSPTPSPASNPAPRSTPATIAASEPPAPPARSGALLWVGAAGLFAVVLGGGLYAVMANGPTTTTVSPTTTTQPPTTIAGIIPPPTVPPATAPPPSSEDVPEPTSQPATVTVSLGSDPPGADVFAGDARLCTTPCLFDLPSGTEASLTFRREGYLDTIERVTPADGLAVSPRLRARRRVTSDGTTGTGAGPAIKTTL